MSTFLDLIRYDSGGPEMGNIHRLTKNDLHELVARVPKYKLEEMEGSLAILLPGVGNHAVLEGGTLSTQLDHQSNITELIDAFRKLASHIPGAVVQDEEGEVY